MNYLTKLQLDFLNNGKGLLNVLVMFSDFLEDPGNYHIFWPLNADCMKKSTKNTKVLCYFWVLSDKKLFLAKKYFCLLLNQNWDNYVNEKSKLSINQTVLTKNKFKKAISLALLFLQDKKLLNFLSLDFITQRAVLSKSFEVTGLEFFQGQLKDIF